MANAKRSGYDSRFNRNIGVLNVEEQETLRRSAVGIAGVGGVGGLLAERMARLGVGRLKIADPEVFEPSNVNRQLGAADTSIGKNKAEMLSLIIKDINPDVQIELYPEGINQASVAAFVAGADIVLMALDRKCFSEMVLLSEEARKRGVWLISSGIHRFGASLLVFPPRGMRLETFFDTGFPGIARGLPANVSSFGPSCALASAMAASEVVVRLTNKRDSVEIPKYVTIDLLNQTFEIVDPFAIEKRVNDLAIEICTPPETPHKQEWEQGHSQGK